VHRRSYQGRQVALFVLANFHAQRFGGALSTGLSGVNYFSGLPTKISFDRVDSAGLL
jgi:hypothetical protein